MINTTASETDEQTLDGLPDVIRPRTEDVTPRDVIVLQHIGLDEHVRVPRREVDLLLHPNGNLGSPLNLRLLLLLREPELNLLLQAQLHPSLRRLIGDLTTTESAFVMMTLRWRLPKLPVLRLVMPTKGSCLLISAIALLIAESSDLFM